MRFYYKDIGKILKIFNANFYRRHCKNFLNWKWLQKNANFYRRHYKNLKKLLKKFKENCTFLLQALQKYWKIIEKITEKCKFFSQALQKFEKIIEKISAAADPLHFWTTSNVNGFVFVNEKSKNPVARINRR